MGRKKIKKVIGYFLVVMATVAVVGCNTGSEGETAVSGTVTDELGVPLTSAIVEDEEGDATVETDSEGNYAIELPNDGRRLHIRRPGFVSLLQEAIPRYRGGAHFTLEEESGKPCGRMDTDDDGVISSDEWIGPDEVFVTIDTDEDGFLSQEELRAAREEHRSRRQRHGVAGRMDADGNGSISKEEWLGPEEIFKKLDANEDGQITKEEARAAFEERRQARLGS